MQEKSITDIQDQHQCQSRKPISAVSIAYQATPDGEKRLLEALTLLLKERVGQHISSEISDQEVKEETEKVDNDC